MKALSQCKQPTASVRRWKILLISANRCTTPEPVFPLGLTHLSAALRQSGHEVVWLDRLVEESRFEEVLSEAKPDLVGISVRNIDDVLIRKQQSFVDDLGGLVQHIHSKLACPVVLGGSGFSILPRELLEATGADFGIVGEGEEVLPALMEALETGGDYAGLPGLVFQKDGAVLMNPPQTHSSEPQLRPSDWPPEIVSHYLRNAGMLNLQTQRGCAHRCCYCTYPVIEGRLHRSRSAEAVASEFEQLHRLGARYVFVVDSVFNSSERHVTEVCEALLRRNVKLHWGCFLRPQGLTREMVRLMGRAGLAHIEFGSDSFCNEVLDCYRKDFTFEDILHSTELVRSEEIDFCHFVIAGGPGETWTTLENSFKNSQVLGNPLVMAVPGMRIYPGTQLFERAIVEGQLSPETNLLKPAFYLAPGLELGALIDRLKAFACQAPNWIIGDFDPAYEGLVARLRRRGVKGPLWSYFSTAQRLWARAEPQSNG